MFVLPFKKYIAFFVMLVTIITNASGIYFKNEVLKPLEEVSSVGAFLSANEDEYGGNADFKPPKNSFNDYTAIFNLSGNFLRIPARRH